MKVEDGGLCIARRVSGPLMPRKLHILAYRGEFRIMGEEPPGFNRGRNRPRRIPIHFYAAVGISRTERIALRNSYYSFLSHNTPSRRWSANETWWEPWFVHWVGSPGWPSSAVRSGSRHSHTIPGIPASSPSVRPYCSARKTRLWWSTPNFTTA